MPSLGSVTQQSVGNGTDAVSSNRQSGNTVGERASPPTFKRSLSSERQIIQPAWATPTKGELLIERARDLAKTITTVALPVGERFSLVFDHKQDPKRPDSPPDCQLRLTKGYSGALRIQSTDRIKDLHVIPKSPYVHDGEFQVDGDRLEKVMPLLERVKDWLTRLDVPSLSYFRTEP